MSLSELVEAHAQRLAAAGVPTPRVDALQLARHVLGIGEAQVRTAPVPGPRAAEELEALVARRAERVPLQLLVGSVGFRLLDLACRPGVFIPRPETEIVTGEAIAAVPGDRERPVVLEPCTGTGAIALSIAAEVRGVQVVATDVSGEAIELARSNLRRVVTGRAGVPGLAVGASCTFLEGDLLDPVDRDLRRNVDVVVSNPPYLPAADRGTWEPEVSDHDPDVALVGGTDGHEVVWALLEQARPWLRDEGVVVVEIDDRRAAETRDRAAALGYVDIRIVADLTGAERVIVARRGKDPA